jgi:hypothetical protein
VVSAKGADSEKKDIVARDVVKTRASVGMSVSVEALPLGEAGSVQAVTVLVEKKVDLARAIKVDYTNYRGEFQTGRTVVPVDGSCSGGQMSFTAILSG